MTFVFHLQMYMKYYTYIPYFFADLSEIVHNKSARNSYRLEYARSGGGGSVARTV